MSGPDRKDSTDGTPGPAGTPAVDTGKPHPARMYDWMLGGKDNYPADEELARRMLRIEPRLPLMARMNRGFMHRSTRWLARQGVRQFLDIGTGIPTEPNLHQIAQEAAPDARVVYCDNDPTVLAHAGALLRGTPEGTVEFLHADAREIDVVLERAAKVLDFGRPVAVSLIALLHFVSDEDGADRLVERVKEALTPGSHLVMSHFTTDFHSEEEVREATGAAGARGYDVSPRGRDRFTRFFDGLELVEPGVVLAERWRPELGEPVPGQGDGVSSTYAGVARRA
ncbi:SAM-dependent methyltransferase [Streptomyces abyssomicinicus]|uniref:SAM-dependent methyltransferase n=1 Tax=Streptomyces abyssomicinicus TaxID=574929 RepID=UPI00125088E0|nr:SAM-dependent methyltransferase [Streptomyces abyssomicinicus]